MERRANELLELDRPEEALAIWLFMADGDPSLGAGWLTERIRWCFVLLGLLHAAKWWYGRAVEENPTIGHYMQARKRLEAVNIDRLLA